MSDTPRNGLGTDVKTACIPQRNEAPPQGVSQYQVSCVPSVDLRYDGNEDRRTPCLTFEVPPELGADRVFDCAVSGFARAFKFLRFLLHFFRIEGTYLT